MAFINLPGIPCWGNPYSQRVRPSPVFLRLIQRDVSVKSRFLGRPRLLIRVSLLAVKRAFWGFPSQQGCSSRSLLEEKAMRSQRVFD